MCLNDYMPKKTKRQKIAAEMHKHKIVAQFNEVSESIPLQQTKVETKQTSKKMLFTTESTLFFKKDLTKSLIVTGVLLTIELGIYIAQLNGLSFSISLPF